MAPKRCRVLTAPASQPAGGATRARVPPLQHLNVGTVETQVASRTRVPQELGQARKRWLATAPLAKARPLKAARSLDLLTDATLQALGAAGGDDAVETAGESSSEPGEAATPGKRRVRAVKKMRSKTRLRKYLGAIASGTQRGVTALEELAVSAETKKSYVKAVEEFCRHAGISSLELGSMAESELDEQLAKYFTLKFLSGEQASFGDRCAAGLLDLLPAYGKLGNKNIPRTWRALKAWRKLTPSRPRKARPLAVWCALANQLASEGRGRMALFTMMGLSIYARPSSLMRIRKCDIIPPAGGVTRHWCVRLHPFEEALPSKTDKYNEGCPLDSRYLSKIGPLLEVLANADSREAAWDFDYGEYTMAVKEAATMLGVDLVPYEMRHSGASIDIAAGVRGLAEAQKRGTWAQVKSMHRYEQSAILAAEWQRYSTQQQSHFRLCETWIEEILAGQRTPIRPLRAPLGQKVRGGP